MGVVWPQDCCGASLRRGRAMPRDSYSGWTTIHRDHQPLSFRQNNTLLIISSLVIRLLSKLVFEWLTPFLSVGFSRPLEKEDLWDLPPRLVTHNLTEKLQTNFYDRCPPEKRPSFLRHGHEGSQAETLSPRGSEEDGVDSEKGPHSEEPESPVESKVTPKETRSKGRGKKGEGKPKYDSSLLKALHTTFFWPWWAAGFCRLISDTLKTTTPLISKLLLEWLTEAYMYARLTDAEKAALGMAKPRGIGYGMGLGVALFAMQELASLTNNHSQMMSMTVGISMRTSLIGNIFRKSLRLSGKARTEHSSGQITTMISTDATRMDRVGAFAHIAWIAPIQIVIGIGLLIGNLGYSALVGLGVLILGFPLQMFLVSIFFGQRKKGVKITDMRVRLLNEVLQGIRLIKFYAWETFYGAQIAKLRAREVSTIRKSASARAALIALVTFLPVCCSVLSFITYALSGHNLNVAIIFSSLQYFNIIRTPLMFLPIVLSAMADASVALQRISKFLTAEELEEPYKVDWNSPDAVDVEEGDFRWETARGADTKAGKFNVAHGKHGKKEKKEKKKEERKGKKDKSGVLPSTTQDVDGEKAEEKEKAKAKEEEKPFELKNVNMKIPKGSFVAIVGRVGSGKSSLLQGLIGEMRKIGGHVTLGGTVAYVPQSAWIMNATLRQNILFGQDDDDKKFRNIIQACCLEHDLEMLPHAEDTEIGEKGINLSGGQKARVSLARAAYAPSDIVLLDDSLSAVDAWVGKAILENCLLNGPLSGKTRVLVTHALHVLDKVDYIYVMDEGTIVEQGTYSDLMATSQVFGRLMEEYGNLEQEKPRDAKQAQKEVFAKAPEQLANSKAQAELMQTEERVTGAVTWTTYKKYLHFGGSVMWAPLILLLLVLMQGASVGNNLFLGYWTAESVPGFNQADYMGVYAALGVAQAILSFGASITISLLSLAAGFRMFKAALMAVLRSPISFFDTTPMGRIISRLSKDQDTVDTELSMTLFQFLSTFSNVLGTVALVFYTFPYLGIIFLPLGILYYIASMFYRRSSVETKRLDSLLRSALYASYTETLTGLSTVRAYREQDRFIQTAEGGLDLENKAYYMTIAIQRWLGVRLDFFGNILILGIALFAAGFRTTVSPSKIGVVLSYSLNITQTLSDMVSTFAQNEQNMNAVERILVYTELPSEAAHTTPDDPPPSWPEKGEIKFNNVKLAYRKGLPLVLKGVSFDVKPGEKVGIVGRTGAGKSSLLQALFRIVELEDGKIEIDGHNIRDMGLDVLRGQLALVPQDSTLFLGTLRENLDPQASRTDAEIISALRRAWLLPKEDAPNAVADAKFSLDSPVTDEGSNFSAGEKQLLALCRALVKNSRIIILDEATSSVDVETDAKVQRTIQSEFSTSTLLCIAHRLNTIAYYDRVLVMDSGEVAEFDTPLNLFDRETSIFRSLCNEAGLTKQDIIRIRAGTVAAGEVVVNVV
ncbi:hypothetical protein JAAARDRAFT_38897 [Jaapia argillacea MUCL 33604]|uniref:Multidrug resistance-associated ABC transporter n=1 Tax=Jaapia argillacea MUCL 33604 TaxID=933084 RepID=A0A067PRL1_9AGAM|nr:hypothetical protein JAAARDRAFT_38897 [Jaapia argillacea MUCL 33604]